ncbi:MULTISPECIES: HEAT repeat domain-containing protein [unclassified Saccharothrix]|uniref:HEAT repeat domain-containing protein n=1 Tax=unclassified Saccharothrix TaxID=2593673 RepID=UPI00307CCFC1
MLSDERIAIFETVHGVEIPEGYRAFLTEVGDGGLGPGYGLCPLSTWRSVELPGNLAEVELDGRVHRGLRVVEWGGTEATVLLVTGPNRGRLVDRREAGVGSPPELRPEPDFPHWYLGWAQSANASVAAPRSEEALLALLSSADEAERALAVYELGALENPSRESVRLIEMSALVDPASNVRYQAVQVLGEFGARSVDVLLKALRDEKRSISRRALVHIMRLAGASGAWQEAVRIMRSGTDRVGMQIADDLEARRVAGMVIPGG